LKHRNEWSVVSTSTTDDCRKQVCALNG
jgi:hypothetical protein